MTDHAQDPRRAEFEALAVPHFDALYRFAARRLGAAHEAEDAVQEACLKAYRAFDRFERGTDFRAWLFRILVNTVTDRRRRAGRTAPMVDLDVADTRSAWHATVRSTPDPERQFLARSQAAAVRRAVTELPEEWQVIVTLCFVDGLSYREIATILDCPIGTVMSRLYRSRQILARRLAAYLAPSDGGPPTAAVASLDAVRTRLARRLRGKEMPS